VEQTCHRCGAVITADTAYCSQCGAPQVRVPESFTAATPASATESGSSSGDNLLASAAGIRVNWRHALPSASAAGFAMAVATMLPILSSFFPLWMLGGGWLAVNIYIRRTSLFLLPANIGAKVGALAGLLGFVFFAIFTSAYLTIATVIMHQGEQIRASLRSVLEQAAANNHDPHAHALAQWMQTPQGLAFIVAFSMFLFLVAFLLLSSAGGIFAASMARKKKR
jgi:hypothetical protein